METHELRVTWENVVLQHPPPQDSSRREGQEEQDALGTQCKTNKSMLEREQGSLEELKRLF